MSTYTCMSCGTEFSATKPARFCSTPCRKSFNNTRMQRGALLYDAMMAMRYDRKRAADLGVDWKFVCRIAEMFHAQDEAKGQAQSWRPTREMKEEFGAVVNARRGRI